MTPTFCVHGLKSDLDSLKKLFLEAGEEKYTDELVRASHIENFSMEHFTLAGATFYLTRKGCGIIKHWLSVREKRMVTYRNDEKQITIKGAMSVKNIQKLLAQAQDVKVLKKDIPSVEDLLDDLAIVGYEFSDLRETFIHIEKSESATVKGIKAIFKEKKARIENIVEKIDTLKAELRIKLLK